MNSTKPRVGDLVRIIKITAGDGEELEVNKSIYNMIGLVSALQEGSKNNQNRELVEVDISPLQYPASEGSIWWFFPEELETIYES